VSAHRGISFVNQAFQYSPGFAARDTTSPPYSLDKRRSCFDGKAILWNYLGHRTRDVRLQLKRSGLSLDDHAPTIDQFHTAGHGGFYSAKTSLRYELPLFNLIARLDPEVLFQPGEGNIQQTRYRDDAGRAGKLSTGNDLERLDMFTLAHQDCTWGR